MLLLNDKLLQSHSSKQSSEIVYVIENFDVTNVGKYTCSANNSKGEAHESTNVGIQLAPIVIISPKTLHLNHQDEQVNITCNVKGAKNEFKIIWKTENEILKTSANITQSEYSDVLTIDSSKIEKGQIITC